MEAIDPGIAASISGDKSAELQKSIKSVESLINTIMTPMQSIIDKMIELAQSANIEKDGVEAIKAIAAVIGAIGALMKAFSPSDAAFAAAEKAQGFWNPNGAAKLMKSIQDGMAKTIEAASGMIYAVSDMIVDIAAATDGADFEAVGPLLDAIPPILQAIGGIMKALSPSDAQMKAVQEAAGTWGGDEVGLMEQMKENMVSGMKAAEPLIRVMGQEIGKMVSDHLLPMVEAINGMDVDPAVLGAVADIVAALMQGMGKMMEVVGPAMETMSSKTEDNWLWGPSEAEQMSSQMSDFGNMMAMLGESFTNMLPAIKGFVVGLLEVAKGIGNPEEAAAQLEVVGQAVKALGDVTGPLMKTMEMIGKYKGSGSWNDNVYWYFGSPGGGGKDGLLAVLVSSVGRSIASFLNQLKPVMAGIGNPKLAGERLAVIMNAIKGLANVTGPMMKAMDMVGKNKGSGTKWDEEVSWYFKKGGFLDTLVEAVGRGISNFMTKIKSIKIDNPEHALKKIDVITAAIAAAGTLLKMVGDGMKMIAKHRGGSSWASELEWYFKVPSGMVYQMASSLGDSLGIIVTKIMDTVKGIPNPDHAKKQIALVAQILEAVSTFVGVIDTVSKLKVKGGKGATKGIRGVMDLVAGISAQLAYSMPQVIDGVLGAIEGSDPAKVSKLWKYRHSIKILGTLMCAVGQFAAAIETMSSIGGGGKKAKKALVTMGEVFSEGGSARQALINIVAAVGAVDFSKMTKGAVDGMVRLGKFMTEMDTFVGTVSGMTWNQSFYKTSRVLMLGLPGGGKGNGPIAMAQKLIEAITGGFKANSSNIHVETMTKLAMFLTDGLVPAMSAINRIPTAITDRVANVKTAVTDLQAISAAISSKEIRAAVQIGEALAGSGYISLDLTKDLTMNVHVQVNMNAEQIAKGVVKTDTMKSSLGQ